MESGVFYFVGRNHGTMQLQLWLKFSLNSFFQAYKEEMELFLHLIKPYIMDAHGVKWWYNCTIPNLSIAYRQVHSLTTCPFTAGERAPLPIVHNLDGHQGRSER
jgi:hypothetical protein